MLWLKVYITQYSDLQLFLVWNFSYLFFLNFFFNWAVRLCVRDDNYGWVVVEKSTNHCVVRWVLNSFDFYLLSYRIIDMYTQRLNFSYFACIYLLFRLVTKSSVNPIWRHLCLSKLQTPDSFRIRYRTWFIRWIQSLKLRTVFVSATEHGSSAVI